MPEEEIPLIAGDYVCLLEDIKVGCTDGQIRSLEKYSPLQIFKIEGDETILYSIEHDFYYDVGGAAFGLFPKEGPGVDRYQAYKAFKFMASAFYGQVVCVINRLQCWQENDRNVIAGWVDKILADNPKQIEKYKAGNTKLFGYFVGQTMKNHKSANPEIVNELLTEKLK